MPKTYTVCLAGNPNVGKSTLFNALTGLHQHTGNWTGKTVDPARGSWTMNGSRFILVDLPGVYSLSGGTPEERLASEALEQISADCIVVILDASALARTLPLALELRCRQEKLLCCLNLMDEAKRLGAVPDPEALSRALCCGVVSTAAHRAADVKRLRAAIARACLSDPDPEQAEGLRKCFPQAGDAAARVRLARALASLVCDRSAQTKKRRWDWDRLFLGRFTAYPAALCLIFLILWLTIRGANVPSSVLERGFSRLGALLADCMAGWPEWLRGMLIDGVYGTSTKVIAVMLPPMAIFFPLFTLLEELGYLPRFALLLDRPFAWAGTCGRQGITMCMGCGCNTVGVTGCRIIGPAKQRLAAILTNSFVPCNGRFPTLILLLSILRPGAAAGSAAVTALYLTGILCLSAVVTLLVTRLLRHTLLKGEEGSFVLELPPFRRPKLGRLLLRSVLERTLRVLLRAVTVAAPAGLLLWTLSRLQIGPEALLVFLARRLDPAAALMGLSGALLLAFFLSFPANELLLPLTVLILSGGGAETAGTDLAAFLAASGVTAQTALCAALFTLFHWPCSTTVLTVYHETKSLKWTAAAILFPTAAGVLLCTAVSALFRLF